MASQDKSREIELFSVYGSAGGFDAFDESAYARVFRELLAQVRPGARLRAADLGCATGAFTARMASLGFSVTGLDLTPACIAFARRAYPDLHFEVGDIEQLPFPDASFDLVTLFGVLHHFPDMRRALSECRRVLRTGGLLFALDPRMQNPFIWLYRHKRSPFYSSCGVTENESPRTREQLLSALRACSFSRPHVYPIAGMPLNPRSDKFGSRVRLLMPVYNWSERLFDLPLLRPLLGSYLVSTAVKEG